MSDDDMELASAGFARSVPAMQFGLYRGNRWMDFPRECLDVVNADEWLLCCSEHYKRFGLNVQVCVDYLWPWPVGHQVGQIILLRSNSGAFKKCFLVFAAPTSMVQTTHLTKVGWFWPLLIKHNLQDTRNATFTTFTQVSAEYVSKVAFGLLVAKWRTLKHPLCVSLRNTPRRIHACMRLHNFCFTQTRLLTHQAPLHKSNNNVDSFAHKRFKSTQYEMEGGDVIILLDDVTRNIIAKHISNKTSIA